MQSNGKKRRLSPRFLALRAEARHRGFTLIELLVVIAVIGILASLLLPVFSRSKQSAQGVSCLNNGKQMMIALTMYGGDNKEYFPPNPDDGNTMPGYNWCSGQAGNGQPEEFNPEVLKDPTRSLLVHYLGGNISPFKCPADKRTGPYQGTDPALVGHTVPNVRTFSMNQAVGTIDPGFEADRDTHSGAPTSPVNGPWLNSQHTHHRDSPWYTYGKLSSINAPGPSMLWVLVDEDPRGLDDAAFAFAMEQPMWINQPGVYHNGGCGFAFADGHSETHRWLSRSPKPPWGTPVTNPQDRQDWLWMRERTSADSTGKMPAPP
jgi:prepilin-type N-terminal cleavage/methylation domain-containing protein/prepilin-type processing-associated H-X9-DG protein